MARGVKHYRRDGTVHMGGSHKMPNGELYSGAKHQQKCEIISFQFIKNSANKSEETIMPGKKNKPKPY